MALDPDADPPFLEELHAGYVIKVSKDRDSFEQCMTEHLRMSGVYWGLMAMVTMGRDVRKEMEADLLVEWVLRCQHPNGGFGGNEDHDPHLLYTLSALQILAILGALDRVNGDTIAAYIAGLQQDDGSFFGDEWGEVDTRFSYCALSALAILGKLPGGSGGDGSASASGGASSGGSGGGGGAGGGAGGSGCSDGAEAAGSSSGGGGGGVIDVDAAASFVGRCRNFDGGFGCVPGTESHAGQVFTCVGALAIAGRLDLVDADLLGWWLCERQCDSGGLNGRPEKQADVCYSWWILSALSILGRVGWIDRDRLAGFILRCQDSDDGGVAERPGNAADVFHTFFGIAGLSLLGRFDDLPAYRPVDPIYALPRDLVLEMGLPRQVLPPPGS